MARGKYKNSKDWKEQGSKRINPKVAKAYNTEYAKFAQNLAASGAGEIDIAYIFGTSTYNLRKWKSEHPEFSKSIKRGKQLTKAWLVGKGIKAAGGYDWIEEKQQYVTDEEGNRTGDIKVTRTNKHQAADGRLLIFLLSCLSRKLGDDDFVAKQFVETKVDENVTIKVIDGNKIAEQLDKLAGKWATIDAEVVKPKQLKTTTVGSDKFVDSSEFEEIEDD